MQVSGNICRNLKRGRWAFQKKCFQCHFQGSCSQRRKLAARSICRFIKNRRRQKNVIIGQILCRWTQEQTKKLMVNSSKIPQPLSIWQILTVAVSHGFAVWTSDVKKPYLHSGEPLGVEFLIVNSPPAYGLQPDKSLWTLTPLHGLYE